MLLNFHCIFLETCCMLGFIRFRYWRFFTSNKKKKENLVSEQFMPWTGKVPNHLFKQSTTVLQIIFNLKMVFILSPRWYVIFLLLLNFAFWAQLLSSNTCCRYNLIISRHFHKPMWLFTSIKAKPFVNHQSQRHVMY